MLGNLLGYLMIYSMIISCLTAADLTFAKTLKEVTTLPNVEVVKVSFDFENTSDSAITIMEFDAPCACMEARILREDKTDSLVFKPGEKGSVIGELDFGTPKLIAADKETLEWQVGEAKEKKTFMIKISKDSDAPINIISQKHGFGTDEVFDCQLETVKAGLEYKVTVVPKKTDKPAMGVVKFYTDSKIARYKLVQVFLLVDHPEK